MNKPFVETHVGITHEAQYGILVFQQTVLQVVSNRSCDPTTLLFPSSRNRRGNSLPPCVRMVLYLFRYLRNSASLSALVDRVADLAQQFVHQACLTLSVGRYDKGEVPKEMRSAYLMLALEVLKVCCPAIVDQRTGVDRKDAERVDGFLAPLAMGVILIWQMNFVYHAVIT